MSEIPAEAEICEHYWAWVKPAGTSNSARLCMLCHQPDADWLNTIIETSRPCTCLGLDYICPKHRKRKEGGQMPWLNSTDLLVNPEEKDFEKHIVFRQVGWHGQTGRFYTMDEQPSLTEPGGFGPMYIQIMPE